ncbi:hypothetical protein ACWCPF_32285 [Streptomyces sp. NPDC001858]
MPSDPDQPFDPAADCVALATEAALLEARIRLLREAIDTVDARIRAASEALRVLQCPSSGNPRAEDRRI